jgi:small subunit ribosomal protein S9
MKQDPYFKHHLQNHLRQFAEGSDFTSLNLGQAAQGTNLYDHVKFDRINIYDFRRALP